MTPKKILPLGRLKAAVRRLRREGRRIATTNGTFDLLHVGHVRYLERARRLADVLIVAVNGDASVRRLKGPDRPIVPARERAEILAALACVDYVTIFNDLAVTRLLRALRPDLHVKGGSFVPARIREERRIVESWGGRFVALPLTKDRSTTRTLERISVTVYRPPPQRGTGTARYARRMGASPPVAPRGGKRLRISKPLARG